MIEDSIRNLKDQLLWASQVVNGEKLKAHGKVILCGMGGSRIASGFLKTLRSDMNIQIWNDYGLPMGYERDSMVIVSSYSGTTEESIGNFIAAQEEGLQTAVIASGGDLLALAKDLGVPYVELPLGHHPRMAAGYHFKALISILGDNAMQNEVNLFINSFSEELSESAGKNIGESINGTVLIYASRSNRYLAEYFKISLNETAKQPAYSNILPELAHNELSGIPKDATFILLHDPLDHPRVQVKMGALEVLLKEKGSKVINFSLNGSLLQKIWSAYAVASWSGFYLAKKNNIDPEGQEIIEEFKKRIH